MENENKQPLVQVKDLCKYFQINRHATLKAVDHVSFDIHKGETVGLVGESGCGKSTTGRCMIRLYEPTEGEVIYDGKDITKLSKEEQKKRFLERLNDESKNWKFSSADIKERQYWNHYMKAYSDVLTETSTEIAPWYVIPADNKWFMRYAVGRIICTRMEALDLHYPQLSKEELEKLEECKKSVSDINF